MGIRTPPSLKWLIDKKSRLLGELAKLDRRRPALLSKHAANVLDAKQKLLEAETTYEVHSKRLERLEKRIKEDIEAIAHAMTLHDVQIDQDLIPARASQEAHRPHHYGSLTRAIYRVLKVANGAPISATDVALELEREQRTELTSAEFSDLRGRVRHRLKALCAQGKVHRLHEAKTQLEGRWILSPEGKPA
jgi:hypothetical protein